MVMQSVVIKQLYFLPRMVIAITRFMSATLSHQLFQCATNSPKILIGRCKRKMCLLLQRHTFAYVVLLVPVMFLSFLVSFDSRACSKKVPFGSRQFYFMLFYFILLQLIAYLSLCWQEVASSTWRGSPPPRGVSSPRLSRAQAVCVR